MLHRALLLISLILFLYSSWGHSEEKRSVPSSPIKKVETLEHVMGADHEKGVPFHYFYPFVPRKSEWNVELGSMWEANTMYWAGLMYGKNIGTCVLTDSQTCQQYIDLIGGVGGRDGYTNGIIMPSLRWQFVSFPKSFSTSARAFVGVMNILDEERDKENLIYGVGYGITRTVHKNIDLKIEFRVGGGEYTWSQVFVSFGVRVGAFIKYFATKMGGLGIETVKTTGSVLKKSGEFGVKVIKKSGEVSVGTIKKVGEVGVKAGKSGVSAVKKVGEVGVEVIEATGEAGVGVIRGAGTATGMIKVKDEKDSKKKKSKENLQKKKIPTSTKSSGSDKK